MPNKQTGKINWKPVISKGPSGDHGTEGGRQCVSSDCGIVFTGWNWGMGAWWANCACNCTCMGCVGSPNNGSTQYGGCSGGCDVSGRCGGIQGRQISWRLGDD